MKLLVIGATALPRNTAMLEAAIAFAMQNAPDLGLLHTTLEVAEDTQLSDNLCLSVDSQNVYSQEGLGQTEPEKLNHLGQKVNQKFTTYIEDELVTTARKNLFKLLEKFGVKRALDVVSLFDKNLTVSLSDAVTVQPIINGVKTEALMCDDKVKGLGSRCILEVYSILANLNYNLHTKQNQVGYSVDTIVVDDFNKTHTASVGILDKDKVVEIVHVALSCSRDSAMSCLVGHYGMKVAGAEEIIRISGETE